METANFQGIKIVADASLADNVYVVRGSFKPSPSFMGNYPVGHEPEYRPNDSGTGCEKVPNWMRPGYIGDPPWPHNQPGDQMVPYYPEYDRIWPQIYPFKPYIPPLDREEDIKEEMEKIVEAARKKMSEVKEKQYPKDKVRLRDSRTDLPVNPNKLEKNHRAIDLVVTSYTAAQISIKIKDNKINVTPLWDDSLPHWPMLEFYDFDIDERIEEVVSAKIKDGILTILIKNTYVAPPEKIVPISE